MMGGREGGRRDLKGVPSSIPPQDHRPLVIPPALPPLHTHLELAVHTLAHRLVDGERAHRVADVGRVQDGLDEHEAVGLTLGVKLQGRGV